MKRVMAILLTVCMLLPLFSTVVWADSGSYEKLVDVPYTFNAVCEVNPRHEIYSHYAAFDPIDLTAYGYPASDVIESGKLGLQMDICVSGKEAVVKAMETVPLTGQLEFSSSGTCDEAEVAAYADVLEWKANEWNRVVVDLAQIMIPAGKDAFDPTNFNYMRMYIGGLTAYDGQHAYMKVANVQIVDLTRSLAAEEAPALGDGTPADEVPPQSIVLDAPAYKELAALPYRGAAYSVASNEVYSVEKVLDAIDLTQWGYLTSGNIEPGKLGLQMDYYIDGGPHTIEMLEKGQLTGQIEITSSGMCDVNEVGCSPNRLKGKAGEWVRVFLDFSWFADKTGEEFDPRNFNYFRMYISVAQNYPNEQLVMKFANLRVVDLSQPLSGEEVPEIGDGTFTPDAPEFKVQTIPTGYETDTAVVAGYNLKEYAQTHGLNNVTNWSPVIQSLLFGLAAQGGGMLYIPAGIYPCYEELNIPTGVTLQGDWVNPDESLQIFGTVLAVYAGKNTTSGAFVQMGDNSYVRSMAFWYPDQNAAKPIAYPYTIQMGTTCHLKDITLVNSYCGVITTGGSCPDTESIYGTPLSVGMDMDMISDSYGMENIHFAPDYWMYSGLMGAPSSKEDSAALKEMLYASATGIIVRRMDWSWTTYSSVKGYTVGMYFAQSKGDENYPNGQCYEMLFEDCYTALQVDNVGGAGMVMNGFTVKNCRLGVFYTGIVKNTRSSLTFFRADISTTQEAVMVECPMATVSFNDSIIRKGDVRILGGWLTMLDTQVNTNITLEQGAQMGIFANVTDVRGGQVKVNNKAHCPLWQETKNSVSATQQPVISREDGLYSHHRAPSNAVTVASLDNTGETDVSEALNALLQAQKTTGGTVFVPPGYYRIDNAITIPSGVELLGSLDFGQAELYNGVGTIFQIYHGKNQPDKATIIVEANAGVRGLQINYPEQNIVDGSFIPYAHTIQGRGENAYVINVSSRNSWSGVDFMTHRCDNHYIDSFRGSALKSYVAVGGGAENGVVRNCHLQYTSWTYGDSARGSWPRVVEDPSREAREAWRMDLYMFSGHNLDNYTIGHVKNQLHFGNMNYCGYTGINIVPEETGLADVTIFGQNTDCCTISMNIEAAERVDFINLQTTAFTWIQERQEAEMNLIHLGKDCDITVNVYGAALYENPDYMFDVENGTLNIWGGTYKSSVPMTNVGKNGKINLVNMYFGAYQSGFDKLPPATELVVAVQNPQNVNIYCSTYYVPLADADTLGTVHHVYDAPGGFRMDVPADLQVPSDGELLFSEGFTDYNKLQAEEKKVAYLIAGDGNVQARMGNLQITHSGFSLLVGITAENQLNIAQGKARLELRLNLNSMRQTANSTFVIALNNELNEAEEVARFDKDATFQVKTQDGWKTVGNFSVSTWYRVGVVVDMDAKTMATYLMDDKYNTLVSGGAQPMKAKTVSGMRAYAEADFDDNTKTVAQVDYMAAIVTDKGYGMTGDVDGNGKIDSTDARLVLQYAVGKINATKLNVALADVDGNGKINSTDARLVLQFAVGKIKAF